MKRIDVNTRIGLIRINQELLSFVGYNSKGRQIYNVKCNYCKNEYQSTYENFNDPRKTGQSCAKCSNIQNKSYERLSASDAQISITYSNYKARAKRKNIEFEMTRQEFKDIVTSNCHYCNSLPTAYRNDRLKDKRVIDCSLYMNGIDRIDSSIGYIKSNILPCCEDCNKAKRNLSYTDFVELVRAISKNLKL